ncbi:FtsB family cell division protein [Lacticaseibacillus suibinensis]|uniref:FtsB family cell division protein n=1 Tax=Lacticaseibacillus suibinensis TaxID=2486011 RepID=UPI000F7A065B|nr:septum formation initiator family protein [Lacticaseibacillus suibinensis]
MQQKIRPLHPQSTKPAAPAKSVSTLRVHKRRLGLMLAALLLVCGFGSYQLVSTHNAIETRSQTLSTAKATLKQKKTETANLKVKIDQLNNEDYLAKLIRERYLMSKKGEVVFSLPTTQTDTQK